MHAFATLIAAGAAVLLYGWFVRRYRAHLPPGPSTIPFVGNVHQLPLEFQERKFFEWGRQYGGIVYARLFQRPTIIINTATIAHDLLDKKSSNYSDRPDFTLLEMMGWTQVITLMRYGHQFRKHRKWVQDTFQYAPTLLSFHSLQRRETTILLASLIEFPDAFLSHFRRLTAALIMEVTYGHKVVNMDDEFIGYAERAGDVTIEAGSPGSNILGLLVDFFPILKHYPLWLPGSGFKVKTNENRKLIRLMFEAPFDMVKMKLAAGTAAPSFAATLLEENTSKSGLALETEEEIKAITGMIYSAGTDTTVATLMTFILAMVRYPEVYRKAQHELDSVIGDHRLPDFDDRGSLPYLECIMKEVYRWGATVPLAIPHRSMNHDQYEGYHIPGGAMIIPNIWGMTRDETTYNSPEEFHPERFQDLHNSVTEVIDPRRIVFGFGRRQCPGQQFADATVFLVLARIIATMNISKSQDEGGNSITPAADFYSGFIRRPKPFQCDIRPRSDKVVHLIEQMNDAL